MLRLLLRLKPLRGSQIFLDLATHTPQRKIFSQILLGLATHTPTAEDLSWHVVRYFLVFLGMLCNKIFLGLATHTHTHQVDVYRVMRVLLQSFLCEFS